MGVIEGYLLNLCRLKRNGMFYLKIKDNYLQHQILRFVTMQNNNRPESLRYCIVVPCVHHTYYKNGERGERRKGKVLRAHRYHSRKHQPLNYLHTTRVRYQRHKQSVLLELLPYDQTSPILICS